MISTVQIDTREFDRALKQYLAVTSKTLPEAINHKAGNVAAKAYTETAKADRQKIAADLGAYYGQVMGKRGKLLKGNRILAPTDKDKLARARALFVAQLRRLGKLDSTAGITEKLPLWIKRKVGSAGFLAAGWVPAIRTLLGRLGVPLRGGQSAKNYGRAIRAKDSLDPFAVIENNNTPKENKQSAERVMARGLKKAFDLETADMETYLAKKAQQAANTVIPPGAKTTP